MNFDTVRISSCLAALLLGTGIVVTAYAGNSLEDQVSEAIQLAGGAEVGVAEYFQNGHKMPAHLSDVYAVAAEKPAGRFVASVLGKGDGDVYVIQAVMRRDEYTPEVLKGKSLVLWTTDGGNTWHCGTTGILGVSGTLSRNFLPKSCRE